VDISKTKSIAVGALLVLPSSLLQLVAKPAMQAGTKTEAAPKPTLAKNSFLFIIKDFKWIQ
jgi:hypothetical protein